MRTRIEQVAWLRVVGRYSWRIVRPLLVAYLIVLLMLSFFERILVYPAPRHSEAEWVVDGLPHEDVYFTADDGTKLHGWYVPHEDPKAVVQQPQERRQRRAAGAALAVAARPG
jgi:hypothetical protein